MSRSQQIILALVLAISAIGLLGYSAYMARERIDALQAEVLTLSNEVTERETWINILEQEKTFYEDQAGTLQNELDVERAALSSVLDQQNAFYDIMSNGNTEDAVIRLIAAPTVQERQGIADNIIASLTPNLARFPDGYRVQLALDRMVVATDIAERESEREALSEFFFDPNLVDPSLDQREFTQDVAPKIVQPVVIEKTIAGVQQTATLLTGLLTTLGGVASGLISLFLVLMGRGKQRIEEDMLLLDLEMKQVDLAQARFDAREALSAMEKE